MRQPRAALLLVSHPPHLVVPWGRGGRYPQAGAVPIHVLLEHPTGCRSHLKKGQLANKSSEGASRGPTYPAGGGGPPVLPPAASRSRLQSSGSQAWRPFPQGSQAETRRCLRYLQSFNCSFKNTGNPVPGGPLRASNRAARWVPSVCRVAPARVGPGRSPPGHQGEAGCVSGDLNASGALLLSTSATPTLPHIR